VAQSATFVGKPTSPKKTLLLAFGLIAALGGALALPFVSEIFDETLRTTEQVEQELGLPVRDIVNSCVLRMYQAASCSTPSMKIFPSWSGRSSSCPLSRFQCFSAD